MEKENKLKETILINLIKLFLSVLTLSVAVYAWFMNDVETEINALSVVAEKIVDLQISLDEGQTWSQEAVLDIEEDYTFYNEVTSNGIDFYKAGSKTIYGIPKSFIEAEAEKDYMEFKVYMKSDVPANVYLEEKSSIYPAAGESEVYLLGTPHVIRESSDGNFSKDLIAGATRVAFINNKKQENGQFIEENETSLVWAPNKGYEIDTSIEPYIASINSQNSQNYNYINVESEYVFEEKEVPNFIDTISTSAIGTQVNDENLITAFSNEEIESGNNLKVITIRIWVEGNDRETIATLKGGLFNIRLSFLAVAM